MSYLAVEQVDGVAVVTLDDPTGRTNRTTAQFKAELGALLDQWQLAPPRGAIFRSAKAGFGTGGDIAEVLAHAGQGPQDSFADSQRLKSLYRRLERLHIPTVAVLEGLAVGGGWELALACTARFALCDSTIRLGLPETNLGLVPGGGGLQRLPHLVGGRVAGRLIATGTLQSPMQALDDGLIDDLAPDSARLMALALRWVAANPGARQPWDRPGHQPPDTAHHDGPLPVGQAPMLALEAIARVLAAPFDDGAAIESHLFARLATSAETQALIGLRFLDRNALRRNPPDPGWAAEFTARLAALPTPEAMAQAALEDLAQGRIPSAAAANVASVDAGYPATTGGVIRHLATRDLPQATRMQLQAALAADTTTNRDSTA